MKRENIIAQTSLTLALKAKFRDGVFCGLIIGLWIGFLLGAWMVME